MTNLKIATWNIKNSYFNLRKNEMKAMAIIQLLKEESLDILTLQEVNPILARKINEKLKEKGLEEYQVHSDYQKTINPIKNIRVEYNVIVSKLQPITIFCSGALPYLPNGFNLIKNIPSIRKRYICSQCFQDDLTVQTTHLDHTVEELGKRQMDKISQILKHYNRARKDIILTGNLNRKPIEQNMIDFTKQLSDIGMKVIENSNKTYIGHTDNQPVDYIIVPDSWEVESIQTLENYDDISSHRPVVVETRRK